MNSKTREQRYHELRGISLTSRRMLEAVYAIAFNRYPPDDSPDRDVIQAILDAEFSTQPSDFGSRQNQK